MFNDDLFVYINTDTGYVVYFVQQALMDTLGVFQYIQSNNQTIGITGNEFSDSNAPQILVDSDGHYKILSTGNFEYTITRNPSDIQQPAFKQITATSTRNVYENYPAQFIKLEDIFYVIAYTSGTAIRCDIYIQSYSLNINKLISPTQYIYTNSSQTPYIMNIKPLFIDSMINNRSFILTYTKIQSNQLQIVFDVLHIIYNVTGHNAT